MEYDQARERVKDVLNEHLPDYIEGEEAMIAYGLVGTDAEELDAQFEDGPDEPGAAELRAYAEADALRAAQSRGGGKQKRKEKDLKREILERRARERKALRMAAAAGNTFKVLQISHFPKMITDSRDTLGRSALWLAAERGHDKVVELLKTSAKAEPDLTNNDDWTPLHAAAFNGQVACTKMLMEFDCNVNAKTSTGGTPLIFVASSPKIYVLDLISAKEKKMRREMRAKAFKTQVKLEQTFTAANLEGEGSTKKKPKMSPSDPFTLWKLQPNRLEIQMLDALLKSSKIQVDDYDNKRRTALIWAAQYGRTYTVSRLLAAKANLRFSDQEGKSPLFMACSQGHLETAAVLVNAGAPINVSDQFFRTPLHGALLAGNESLATLLLKAGASVNAFDCEGATPMMLTMDAGNKRLFAMMLEMKASLDVLDKRGYNVVVYAVVTDMLPNVMPILMQWEDAAKDIIRARDPQGMNAIHHAVSLKNVAEANRSVTSLLRLDREAVQMGDCNGDTVIHYAAMKGRLDALRAMIDGLPSVDFLNDKAQTPLHYAAHSGELGCFVTLVAERGGDCEPANAAAIDAAGWSVLMHACASGHLDLVNLILQNAQGEHPDLAFTPLDVNIVDKHGTSAVMIAAQMGHWELLSSLVLAGANISAQDVDGFTAVHWAAFENEPVVLSTLLDLGFDPNSMDSKGWTAMMHATAKGNLEVLRVLVDYGADMDLRNWDGDTALQIACQPTTMLKNRYAVKEILLDGLLDVDRRPTGTIKADGHFMITVCAGEGLYLEGKGSMVNTYVCLQLRTEQGSTPQVAFTSAFYQCSDPVWNETFRFDVSQLDPSAVLVAWVMNAPGNDLNDIAMGAALGLTEEQQRRLFVLELENGGEVATVPPVNFMTALKDTFSRFMRRADRAEDREVMRLRHLAMAEAVDVPPTEDLIERSDAEVGILSTSDRKWADVANLQEVMKKSGCDLPDPLAPSTNLPIGCVIVRMRHLQAAVWDTEPITIDRRLRLSTRGSLRLDIDFRPRFFESRPDPRDVFLSPEEEEELYGLRGADEPETDPKLAQALQDEAKRLSEENVFEVEELEELLREGAHAVGRGRVKARLTPADMYAKYSAVSIWSSEVIQAREQMLFGNYGGPIEDPDLIKEVKAFIDKKIKQSRKKSEIAKTKKELAKVMADLPIGTAPPKALSQALQVQPEAEPGKASSADLKLKLPKLKAPRWVEEYVECSRFF